MKLFNPFLVLFLCFTLFIQSANAQTEERPRPAEWKNLVFGGRFMDRFLPMPDLGPMTRNTWGADNVLPRDIKNGIENREWSFWGGNIKLGNDGKYHFYVCGWLESSPRGHATWPNSTVFHAISDCSFGPFIVKDTIGKGHNPEIFKLSDGRYVLYVIDGYYIADGLKGPWKYGKFDFQNRDRRIIEGLSNLTFAQREDGSYLMVCRGGGVWISETGLTSYNQVTEKRAYPSIKGRFEDPVVWRDNVQYNLIVNDWLGRIAYYLRSKDGLTWKMESGEAYMPGVAKHQNGAVENWHKYERLKILQDLYGRAIQGNFAVIDTIKNEDKGSDRHSSKNISIPLIAGRLLTILNKGRITAKTTTIQVKIAAEPGFNPHTDIDLNSLQFGDPEDVNYGRGGKVLKSMPSHNDLIVTFSAVGNNIPEDEFAAKMLGKTKGGNLIYGYARLPKVDFIEPMLSARLPIITPNTNGYDVKVEVQNFGQVASEKASLQIRYSKDGKEIEVATGDIQGLEPYEKTTALLKCGTLFNPGEEYSFVINIQSNGMTPALLHGKLTPIKSQP